MNRAGSLGFTLIEIAVVVAIIGILAVGVAPLSSHVQKRVQERELRVALREIRSALDRYRKATEEGHILRMADASGYPPNLEVLTEGVNDILSPSSQKIHFLRRLPRDPFFPDPRAPAAATWGLRTYASPADQPEPGKDVFDVFSLAKGIGLNGTPYHEW